MSLAAKREQRMKPQQPGFGQQNNGFGMNQQQVQQAPESGLLPSSDPQKTTDEQILALLKSIEEKDPRQALVSADKQQLDKELEPLTLELLKIYQKPC